MQSANPATIETKQKQEKFGLSDSENKVKSSEHYSNKRVKNSRNGNQDVTAVH